MGTCLTMAPLLPIPTVPTNTELRGKGGIKRKGENPLSFIIFLLGLTRFRENSFTQMLRSPSWQRSEAKHLRLRLATLLPLEHCAASATPHTAEAWGVNGKRPHVPEHTRALESDYGNQSSPRITSGKCWTAKASSLLLLLLQLPRGQLCQLLSRLTSSSLSGCLCQ